MKKKKARQNRRKSAPNKTKKKKRKSSTKTSKNHGRRKKKTSRRFSLPSVEPWKIILGAIVIGILGMVYLNHVFATQKLLGEVQLMQQTYNQKKRSHDSYRLIYERMIGPAEIYNKAKSNGFINGGPADKVIKVEKK